MNETEGIVGVPGSAQLKDWFGYWPSFHDAEVLNIVLDRAAESVIRVHTFRMTKEMDANGHYVTDRHVIVSFFLSGLVESNVSAFNQQNVVFGLELRRVEAGFELDFDPCYGVEAKFIAKKVRIELEPGIPQHSIYAK